MSARRRGIWCVEVVFQRGDHEILVFDDYESATQFLRGVKYKMRHRSMQVRDADVWEM